jgi:hypothetical protein
MTYSLSGATLTTECPSSNGDENFEIALEFFGICCFLEQSRWGVRVHCNDLERFGVDVCKGKVEMRQYVHCLESVSRKAATLVQAHMANPKA